MAVHPLMFHFRYFFGRINPSSTFEQQASREYGSVKALIENPYGPAAGLRPTCFLQGSYKQETAIHTINDVDIVALCALWHPGSGSGYGPVWDRNAIFDTIAAPLLADGRYRDKVRYHTGSMCIKVDLGIKLEILPVVYRAGNNDPNDEPFRLWRVERAQWEDGHARLHQAWISDKNRAIRTSCNFIPAIKVFKHLRSQFNLDAVSFHIECLLFNLPDALFAGGAADYIAALLGHIAATPAAHWYRKYLPTPCRERDIFVEAEWRRAAWENFHELVCIWAKGAALAIRTPDEDEAIQVWQLLLGKEYFPATVSV